MKTYYVSIRELCSVEYKVEAESLAEALTKAINGEVGDRTGAFTYLEDDFSDGMSADELDEETRKQITCTDGKILGIDSIDQADPRPKYISY